MAARTLRVGVERVDAQAPEDIDGAFAAIGKLQAGALIVFPEPMLYSERRKIGDSALRGRLVTVFGHRGFADAGGLMSYAPSYPGLGRRAASYVDKILKGARPADLPVEEPTKFELVINLKTAKALGLDVPDKLLALADEVIE